MATVEPVRADGGHFRRAFTPVMVLLLGIALTTAAAMMSRSSAQREQSLLFAQAVSVEEQNFRENLDLWTSDFDAAVSFVSATFPVAPDEFAAFFDESAMSSQLTPVDPGLTVVELVEPEEVATLEAREIAFGSEDFRVVSLAVGDGPRSVVTRATSEIEIFGSPFVGFDIRPFVDEEVLSTNSLPQRTLFEISEDDAVAGVFGTGMGTHGLPLGVFVEQIQDRSTGEIVGWVARSFDIDSIINGTIDSSESDVNLLVSFLDETSQIIDVDPDSESSFDDAAMAEQVQVPDGNLEFTLSLWSDEDFGPSTGILEQGQVWAFGLLVTAAVFLTALFSASQRHLLNEASFELDHARTLASTDPLTGILNRVGFLELTSEMEVAGGGMLFFIDLDGFKQVNDTVGHAEGDRVLRSVAQIIRTQFRNVDVVSRFGGDEFIVYTPGLMDPDAEFEVAGRVVDAVEQADLGVTASIGSAYRPPYDITPIETLVRKADRAMYSAKELGGNRFIGAKRF